MLLPLVFHGAGKLSVDHLLLKLSGREEQLEKRTGGLQAAGLALLVLGLTSIWIEPVWGFTLLIASLLAILIPAVRGRE
jgi:putative oxidoreductase